MLPCVKLIISVAATDDFSGCVVLVMLLVLPAMILTPTEAIEIELSFGSRDEFLAAQAEHADLFTDATEQTIVVHCQRYGTSSEFFGVLGPEQVSIIGSEMREHLFVAGLNSRQRALVHALADFLKETGISNADAKIYAHEAITPLALVLRGRFPKFIGTEFMRDDEERARMFPIPNGDVCRSDFSGRSV